MRALKATRTGVVAVAAALLVAGCGSSGRTASGPVAGTALGPRTATAGPVEVTVTPRGIDATGARFAIALDNHERDLDGDYASTSTLTVGGRAWTSPRWTGDGPTGHHRSGTLSFTAGGPLSGSVELRLGGLPRPVTLAWDVKG